ncbi:cystathionine gamma-synthase [Pseudozyma hubeiensis SY62]|uniref:Cystathionine gamma-synthase n=1 Tax=Pseudozyma hubeiensis (strain SY62) TaxID=1305764 RepID=R9PEE2_PSEHS|nr:cystathionine gamma-synthase [Pseudozyma hubeiensis SY62]GAC99729.1 cystathionine gamma-synthase [Pseudozyma hubeiensis SY62]
MATQSCIGGRITPVTRDNVSLRSHRGREIVLTRTDSSLSKTKSLPWSASEGRRRVPIEVTAKDEDSDCLTSSYRFYSAAHQSDDLTQEEKQRIAQPFENWSWLRATEPNPNKLTLAGTQFQQEANKLEELHNVLARFAPHF